MLLKFKDFNILELISSFNIKGWTEGLDYHKDNLWLSLPNKIQVYTLDGILIKEYKNPSKYGESICWIGDSIYTVSYSDNNIYKGEFINEDLKFTIIGQMPNKEEHGWGICNKDNLLLITGNYSNKLYYLDPINCKLLNTLNTKEKDIEDLAWDGKYIWSSSFSTKKSTIFSIDPISGNTIKEYYLPNNIPLFKVDGIAIKDNHLWICGKNSNQIYKFKKPIV